MPKQPNRSASGAPQETQPQHVPVNGQYPPASPEAALALGGYGAVHSALGYPLVPQVPSGFYYHELSGLIIPDGTEVATVGRRIGAFALNYVLFVVTLGIGYYIWGAITFANGQTPVQRVLRLQVWRSQERANATWGTMFLRQLSHVVIAFIPGLQLTSFLKFATGKEHRALHDSIASTIVLYDPHRILRPARKASAA
jgi:uncharacterized RDD family membrane protein YckC